MRTHYHEFESLEHLLSKRLLPGGDEHAIRFTVFGGTGAVGGAAVLELCRLILMAKAMDRPLRGEIHATGLGNKEISKFVSRLFLALQNEVEIEKVEALRHYRLGGRIDLHFDILRLSIPQDLDQQLAERIGPPEEAPSHREVERALGEIFAEQPCPFLAFVEALEGRPLHAVVVAIPLPSVATYTLDSIDTLIERYGLGHKDGQRIKSRYLDTFVRGLAVIHQRLARHVVMAHTTAVGGMYRVDGGVAEIRLGFAHSALGKKLVDKKYFADELTQLFVDRGFDVLVTAAAIGIDAVESRCRLPSSRAVLAKLRARAEQVEHAFVPADDLDSPDILLYPSRDLPLDPESALEAVSFDPGKELIVDWSIRSGENGLFSVGNCVALYNVMKVAIPEELAMVLVRRAVYGPERRRDWFEGKIAYYTETENSYFALRLLESYPQLVRAHHGAFSLQALQALGSSTHQARMHELGLVMLCLRLRDLRETFAEIPESELAAAVSDLDGFFWRRTRVPAFEDLDAVDSVDDLATELSTLCRLASTDDGGGSLLGYDARRQGRREPGREKFLHRLAMHIRHYLQCITSLGIPIVYRAEDGTDRVLAGPYVAPMDAVLAVRSDLADLWVRKAEQYETDVDTIRRWVIANNGFVDLRPHALGSSATEPGPHLVDHVSQCADQGALEEWLAGLRQGSYFTTAGLVATLYRLRRLGEQVRGRRVELGTRETWKHLFRQDVDGRHLLSPGLVETVRMYSEGLGKITGTEALWPRWGY